MHFNGFFIHFKFIRDVFIFLKYAKSNKIIIFITHAVKTEYIFPLHSINVDSIIVNDNISHSLKYQFTINRDITYNITIIVSLC